MGEGLEKKGLQTVPHSELLWHIDITSRAPHGALTSVFYSLFFFYSCDGLCQTGVSAHSLSCE